MVSVPASATGFYVTGGTLPRDAACYVPRKADQDLLEGLRNGQFCYVLTSRQMGKSSLMVRTAMRLRQENVICIVLDLTAIGQNLDAERWYAGLLNQLGQQVGLEDDLDDFWLAPRPLGPMQRWMQAVQQIVLKSLSGNLVIFVDEIDAVRSLPFSADEFFAGIRECYNRRSESPEFGRLTSCLLGVATPSDLIRDTRTTPFNIGRRIELTDFTPDEAAPLAVGLGSVPPTSGVGSSAGRLLSRVLYWTGGHPYLTQRLCQALSTHLNADPRSAPPNTRHLVVLVDHLCKELFLSSGAQELDDNLLFVRERLLRSEVDLAALLDLYDRVRQGKRVTCDDTNALVSVLRLSGIVNVVDRSLLVRNRIYGHVFDRTWVRSHMPYEELWRQQAAYRRGVLGATSISLLLLTMAVGLGMMVIWNRHTREEQRAAIAARRAAEKLAGEQKKIASEEKQLKDEAQRERDLANWEAQTATREKQNAETAQRQAEHFGRQALADRAEAERQSQRAVSAEQIADQRAMLDSARSLRLSGDIGRRFDSLSALRQAAKKRMSPTIRMELRNEAIACLSLPIDLRPEPGQVWHGTSGASGEGCIGVKTDGSGYFYSDAKGNLKLRSLADNHVMLSLPGYGERADVLVRQSRNGRYVAVRYGDRRLVVWDTAMRRQIEVLNGYYTWHEFDFSPDGRSMVDNSGQGVGTVVHLRELPSGREIRQIALPAVCSVARFHPTGHKLAFAFRNAPQILIYNLDTDKRETRQIAECAETLEWSDDGKRLTGWCLNKLLYLWDGETDTQIATMDVHASGVPTMVFNHRGDILASVGFDNTVCFWNTTDGALLMRCSIPGEILEFSPDDRHFVSSSAIAVQRWQVTERPFAPEFSVLDGPGIELWDVGLHPNGRIAAVAGNGVKLWDLARGREIGFLPIGGTRTALFSADGKSLFTSGNTGIRRWEVCSVATSAGETVGIGPAHLLRTANTQAGFLYSGLSHDGQTLAAVQGNQVDVIDVRGEHLKVTTVISNKHLEPVAISPNGRYIVAGRFNRNGGLVWDSKTGRQIAELPITVTSNPVFSPDGRWLVTGSMGEFRFWAVPTWKPGFQLKRDNVGASLMAFSPDGRLLAAAISGRKLLLADTITHQHFATLEWAEQNIRRICFNADGSRLIALSGVGLRIWDLRKIRCQLAAMGLDWNAPPLLPDREHEIPQPLNVTLASGDIETEAEAVLNLH